MKTIFATILTLALAAIPAAAKETLTVYTYDSFVSEWGPGAQDQGGFRDGLRLQHRLGCAWAMAWPCSTA